MAIQQHPLSGEDYMLVREKEPETHSLPSYAPETHPSKVRSNDSHGHIHTETHTMKPGKDDVIPEIGLTGLLAAFAILFLPMVTVTFVLLGLVLWEYIPKNFPDNIPQLPVANLPLQNVYYTGVSAGKFALVASWASTVSQIVTGPFMLLFSFLIARELSHGGEYEKAGTKQGLHYGNKQWNRKVRDLLQSGSNHGLGWWTKWKHLKQMSGLARNRFMRMALLGLIINLFFS